MIPLDKLQAVQTIITHDHCSDGLMSAILLKDAYAQIGLRPEIKFVQYGTEAYRVLAPGPNMLFCDFAPFVPDVVVEGQKVPDPEKLKSWVDSGALILDHHRGAKQIVAAFGENGIFADEKAEPGVAGAVLAYQHVWLPFYRSESQSVTIPFDGDEVAWAGDLAKLVGIRDTWQNQDPRWREACCLGEVLRFYPNEEWLADERVLPFHPGNRGFWDERLKLGNLLWTKHEKGIRKCIERSWRFTSQKGTKVVVFEGVRSSSDVAESIDQGADLIMGFDYECETPKDGVVTIQKIIYSTRSHTTFNCMTFAKSFGGGGHTKAAGFNVSFHHEAFDIEATAPLQHTAQYMAAILNPYTLAEVLVNKYEEEPQQGT